MLQFMGPWVPTFKSCIDSEQLDFITFSFATVDSHGKPKVRTCVYRGFLFNNSKTNVLTFTTDKRMLKYKELMTNSDFEACFYFHKSKKQFRFSGSAKIINNEVMPSIVLPPHISQLADLLEYDSFNDNSNKTIDTDPHSDNLSDIIVLENIEPITEKGGLLNSLTYPLVSPKLLKEYLHLDDDELVQVELSAPSEDEWKSELSRHWDNLSRTMKLTFRKPTPGSKIDSEKRLRIDAISRRVDGDKDEVGLENFCVVCLFVNVVDFVDLDNLNNRRWIMSRVKADQWKETEVCP